MVTIYRIMFTLKIKSFFDSYTILTKQIVPIANIDIVLSPLFNLTSVSLLTFMMKYIIALI